MENERKNLEKAKVKAAKALAKYRESMRKAESEEDYSTPSPFSQGASSTADLKPPASPLVKTELENTSDSLHLDPPAPPDVPVIIDSTRDDTTVEVKPEQCTLVYPSNLDYDDNMESLSNFMDRASPPIYFRTGLLDDWSEVGS